MAALGAWFLANSYSAFTCSGGRITGVKGWTEKHRVRTIGLTLEEVESIVDAKLGDWDGDDLVIIGFDQAGQDLWAKASNKSKDQVENQDRMPGGKFGRKRVPPSGTVEVDRDPRPDSTVTHGETPPSGTVEVDRDPRQFFTAPLPLPLPLPLPEPTPEPETRTHTPRWKFFFTACECERERGRDPPAWPWPDRIERRTGRGAVRDRDQRRTPGGAPGPAGRCARPAAGGASGTRHGAGSAQAGSPAADRETEPPGAGVGHAPAGSRRPGRRGPGVGRSAHRGRWCDVAGRGVRRAGVDRSDGGRRGQNPGLCPACRGARAALGGAAAGSVMSGTMHHAGQRESLTSDLVRVLIRLGKPCAPERLALHAGVSPGHAARLLRAACQRPGWRVIRVRWGVYAHALNFGRIRPDAGDHELDHAPLAAG